VAQVGFLEDFFPMRGFRRDQTPSIGGSVRGAGGFFGRHFAKLHGSARISLIFQHQPDLSRWLVT